MTTVYVLRHVYEYEPDEDEVKLIGPYSSEQRAQEAIDRLRDKPGFRDYPNGFEIASVELDKEMQWDEGFMIVPPGPPQTKEYKN